MAKWLRIEIDLGADASRTADECARILTREVVSFLGSHYLRTGTLAENFGIGFVSLEDEGAENVIGQMFIDTDE